MGTLHVVIVDFQLRLGVDLGTGVEQQVLVGQLSIGAAGARVNVDAAIEDRLAAFTGQALEVLIGLAIGHRVLHAQLVVHVALVADHEDAFHIQLGAALADQGAHVVAAQAVAGHQLVAVHLADALLVNDQGADVQGAGLLTLQAVVSELGVVGGDQGSDRIGQGLAFRVIMLNDGSFGAAVEFDDHAGIAVCRRVTGTLDLHVDRLLDTGIGGHFQYHRLAADGAVIGGKGGLQAVYRGCVMMEIDAGGQGAALQLAIVDGDHKLAQCRQGLADLAIGNRVQVTVGQGLQRGVLPAFGLAFREAGSLQVGQRIAVTAVAAGVGQGLGFQVNGEVACRETHADSSSPVSQP